MAWLILCSTSVWVVAPLSAVPCCELHGFLAACGKKGGDASGSESGSKLNFYINNPVCIDPYNVQEDQALRSSTSSLML